MTALLRAAILAGAVAVALLGGCTQGTTPDCSDAQCAVVSVIEAGIDGAPEGGEAGEDDSGGPLDADTDAKVADGGGADADALAP
jgi:hypothetical protein